MLTFREKALLIVLALVALFAGWEWYEARHHQHQYVQTALHADSLAASHDTSKVVDSGALEALRRVYGDSIRAVQRQIVQVQQERTALDRTLGAEGKTNAQIRTIIKTVYVPTATGTAVTISDSTRRSTFHVYQQPYTVDANVSLPPAGRAGQLDLKVATDPATFNLKLTCAPGTGPVRRADAILSGPTWVSASIGAVTQDPLVCNAGLANDLRKPSRALPHIGAFAGYGVSAPTGTSTLSRGWVAGIGAVWSLF